jgi:hypothetical protein
MAHQIWWTKVGIYQVDGGQPGDTEMLPLMPRSVYELGGYTVVGGSTANGILKLRFTPSEALTTGATTDWMNLGARPEEAGPCEAEIVDLSSEFYDTYLPIEE